MNRLDNVNFIYELDDKMINLLFKIEEKLNFIKIDNNKMINNSRLRSIHSSLSIEANSLSLLDVEKIINNKKVNANKNEILEVENINNVYNIIDKLDYKNEDDFLKTYSIMMNGLVNNNLYRNHGEGIIKDGKIVFQAPDSILVPSLMNNLFNNLKKDNINMILLAILFHYYFVYIHPFSYGNGRMARFWVNLILVNYNDNFKYIPIEEEIYFNREEYYKSIEESHLNNNCNSFIRFMLRIINSSIDKTIRNIDISLNYIQSSIIDLIVNNKYITQKEIALLLDKNVRTIKRNFKVLIDNNIIERIGSDKTGYWKLKNN